MHQYIYFLLMFVAFLHNQEYSTRELSSGNGQTPVSSENSTFTAQIIQNVHVNNYINLKEIKNWSDEIQKFYSHRNYKLAWFENGRLANNAEVFIEKLKKTPEEGFPEGYYESLPIYEAYTEMVNSPGFLKFFPYKIVQLDILFTQTYLKYASGLSSGLVKPNELDIVWETDTSEKNLVELLREGIETNSIDETIQKLRPQSPQYRYLIEAGQKLEKQKLNGGWPLPGHFSKLEEDDSSNNVIKIKKYLLATGDLTYNDSTYLINPIYDSRLVDAVKHFQGRHGLKDDGIAGKNTLIEMNQPIDYRLNQIRINLDRLRQEVENPHQKLIEINIPDYSLKYFEDGKITKRMNVVVGKNENSTPSIQDTIDHIIINPKWKVPWSIATKEMLPKIKKDPGYLASNNYLLLKGSYNSDNIIDPYSVDWSEITKSNFSFFIVQLPGNNNALGRIKFMLPNNYSIYLHDTPATHLFSRAQRDFSHGCIRLEQPFELAYILLDGKMTRDEIRDILISRKTETLLLDEKVPVHIHYHTAWVDSAGLMQFRNDVYEFDKISLAVLDK